MAKPNHTAYQIQAEFECPITLDGHREYDDIVGLDPRCVSSDSYIRANNFGRKRGHELMFTTLAKGHITFGYDKANKLMESARKHAKTQFSKGKRPTFFLRKLTMSEFMAHENFKDYKNNTTVKTLYKKYLLMDLLK